MYQDPELLDLLERAKLLKLNRTKNFSPYETPELPRQIGSPQEQSPEIAQQLIMAQNETIAAQNEQMQQMQKDYSVLLADYDLLRQKYFEQLKDNADMHGVLKRLEKSISQLNPEYEELITEMNKVSEAKANLEEMVEIIHENDLHIEFENLEEQYAETEKVITEYESCQASLEFELEEAREQTAAIEQEFLAKDNELNELEEECSELRAENAEALKLIESTDLALSHNESAQSNVHTNKISDILEEITVLKEEKPEISDIGIGDLKKELKNSKIMHLDLEFQLQDIEAKYLNVMLGKAAEHMNVENIMKVQEIILAELDKIRFALEDLQESDQSASLLHKNNEIEQLTDELERNNETIRLQEDEFEQIEQLLNEYDEKMKKAANAFADLETEYRTILTDNKALASTLRDVKNETIVLTEASDSYTELIELFKETDNLSECVKEGKIDIEMVKEVFVEISRKQIDEDCELCGTSHDEEQFAGKLFKMEEQVEQLSSDNENLAKIAKQYKEERQIACEMKSEAEEEIKQLSTIELFGEAFSAGKLDIQRLHHCIKDVLNKIKELQNVALLVEDYVSRIRVLEAANGRLLRENSEYEDRALQFDEIVRDNETLNEKLNQLSSEFDEIKQLDDRRIKQLAEIASHKERITELEAKLCEAEDEGCCAEAKPKIYTAAENDTCKIVPLELEENDQLDVEAIEEEKKDYDELRNEVETLRSDLDECELKIRLQCDELDQLYHNAENLQEERCSEENAEQISKQNGSSGIIEIMTDEGEETEIESAVDIEELKANTERLYQENRVLEKQISEYKHFCAETEAILDEHVLLPVRFLYHNVFKKSSVAGNLDVDLLEKNIEELELMYDSSLSPDFLAEEYKRQIVEYQTMIEGNVKELDEVTELLAIQKEEHKKVSSELMAANAQLAIYNEQISNYAFDKEELEQELAGLRKISSEADTNVDELKEQVIRLQAERDNINNRLVQETSELSDIEKNYKQQVMLLQQIGDLIVTNEPSDFPTEISSILKNYDIIKQTVEENREERSRDHMFIAKIVGSAFEEFAVLATAFEEEVLDKLRSIADFSSKLGEDVLRRYRSHICSLETEKEELKEQIIKQTEEIDGLEGELEELRTDNGNENRIIDEESSKFLKLSQRVEKLMEPSLNGSGVQLETIEEDLSEKNRMLKRLEKDYFSLPRRLLKIYPFEACLKEGDLDIVHLEELVKHDNNELMDELLKEQEYVAEIAQKDAKISELRQENDDIRNLLSRFDDILEHNEVISNDLLTSEPFAGSLEDGVFNASKFIEHYSVQEADLQVLRAENERLQTLAELQNEKENADLAFSKSQIADSQLKLSALERENYELRKSKLSKAFESTGTGFKFSSGGPSEDKVCDDLEQRHSQ